MRAFYATVAWSARLLFRVLYGVRVTGADRLPMTGPFLICSNHRSNLDPPLIGGHLKREISYFAKAELFENKFGGAFLRKLNAFPVKRGQMDKAAMSTCLNVLAGGGALVFFPEGTRAPENGYLYPKFGVGWVLSKTKVPVVPVYLHGTGGAKAFKGGRPQLEVVVGRPIPFADLVEGAAETRDGYQLIADRILDRIRLLSLETTIDHISAPAPIEPREIIENEKLR